MTDCPKSKTRSLKGIFGLWKQPTNCVVFDADCEQQSSDPASSSPDSIGRSVRGRHGVRRLLKRSTSKLFGMIRFRHDRAPSKQRIGEQRRKQSHSRNTCQNATSARETTPRPSVPAAEHVASVDLAGQVPQTAPLPACPNSKKRRHISSSQGIVQPVDIADNAKSRPIRRSQSTPGLTDRLTTKFSTTFGHPTVVRRANLRHRRPSLYSFSSPPQDGNPTPLQKLGDNTNDDSSPSAAQSASGSSPVSQSTHPTSDGIHNSAALLVKQLQHNNTQGGRESATATATANHCGNAKRPEKIQPTVIPSIVTVEAATSAKVFFETYFNRLFAGDSDRSRRQHELEEKLNRLPLSVEEVFRVRQAWWQQETDYLRQGRALRTKSSYMGSVDNISLAGFEAIKVLGKGSFGVVRLVKEKSEQASQADLYRFSNSSWGDLNHHKASTFGALKSAVDPSRSARRRGLNKMKKEVYAMKVIRKSAMLRNCQEGHLRAERDFLVASEKSQWIIQLTASFQDAHNLYLVMDYMIGGDFLSFLVRKDILSEEATKWYIAEMILCVEESHRLGWIHRDVKPDNFLISASGHLKISDFGLAFDGHWSHDQAYYTNHRQSLLDKLRIKVVGDEEDQEEALKATQAEDAEATKKPVQERRHHSGPHSDVLRWRNRKERRKLARSVVGTSQYMAPEVVKGRFYDGRCDWWSIGIILYECLYGFTPFAAESRDHTKDKILSRGIKHHLEWLRFPMSRPSDRLISADAIDLIGQLLQEKEYRLCSRKYMLNDYTHSRRLPGELLNHPADRRSKNYQGHYVYPNDATDIKDHPFFRRIRWDDVHNQKPPFVPKVKDWEDTRYFDDEQPIDDISDGSSETSSNEEVEGSQQSPDGQNEGSPARRSVNGLGNAMRNGIVGLAANFQSNNNNGKSAQKKKKEKKRARDKVLRDEEMGKVALNMRKKSAFLGYSYRRPKDVLATLETERGRPLLAPIDGEPVVNRHWQ